MPSNPKLIEACKEWEKAAELFNKLELYISEDYFPLFCVIRENRAEVTVGSSPGHKTHIDLSEGTLRYYDNDMPVNEAMKQHLEDVGLKCKVETEMGQKGVSCSGVNEDNVVNAFKVLSAATSMDIRVGRGTEDFNAKWDPATEKLWRKRPMGAIADLCLDHAKNMEKISQSCVPHTGRRCDMAAYDYCLSKKVIEKAGEM
jgi:hypothetical protein